MTQPDTNIRHVVKNCPINERTGDGVLVGRCWFALKGNECPRHGNVENAMKHFEQTKKLTPEGGYK